MPVSLTIRRILSIYPFDLPLYHPVAVKVQQLLVSNDYSIDDVIELANTDQSLSSKILQIGNSPAYRGSESVDTIKEAVVRLGAQQVTNIAMAASLSSMYVSESDLINKYMKKLWMHSHAVALGCRCVAMSVGLNLLADRAYMAGLMHDIGKLYLLKLLERLNKSGVLMTALEGDTLRDVFIELHVEQGDRLMNHWNMPQIHCTVVAKHHDENVDPNDLVMNVVRLVNSACRKYGLSLIDDHTLDILELPEAKILHFTKVELDELHRVLEESKLSEW